MGILVDWQIRQMCDRETWEVVWFPELGSSNKELEKKNLASFVPLIEPFSEGVSGNGVISYGLTHAGYDLRLGPEVLVYKNSFGDSIDPKRFRTKGYEERMFDRLLVAKGPVTIPAGGYVLGRSFEYLHIPRNLKGVCHGKSTYARCGVIVNVTPLEPGWRGHLTIEISNSAPCPAIVYTMEGIAQISFERLDQDPETDYAQKDGKYQNQMGVTPAKVL